MENMCKRAFSKLAGVFMKYRMDTDTLIRTCFNQDYQSRGTELNRRSSQDQTHKDIKQTRTGVKRKNLRTVTGEERELSSGNDLMVH